MLKIRSFKIDFLINETKKAFLKFPLPILYSLVVAYLFIYEKKLESNYILLIGIPLSTGLTIYASSLDSFKRKLIPHLTHIIVFIIYLYLQPFTKADRYALQVFLFIFAAHLFVAFSTSFKDQSIMGFWRFNQKLFERFIISFIFSNTIFVGLFLSITIISFLFLVSFPSDLYLNLWIATVFIFNTWFFVADIPLNQETEISEFEYPKKLKLLVEYVLIPLLCLYFLILYVYLVNIIIAHELPKGKVGYLVSFASLFGIFTLLLGHPLLESSERSWFRVLFKGFYVAVIPLSLLMLFGLSIRFNQYGITEGRYLLFAIGIWLIGISLYFIFTKTKNIRLIPMSLCVISLIISFGPWNVWNVSYKSQTKRLIETLAKMQMIKDGRIIKSEKPIQLLHSEFDNMLSLMRYHLEYGKRASLENLYSDNLHITATDPYSVLNQLNIQERSLVTSPEPFYTDEKILEPRVLDIKDYEFYVGSLPVRDSAVVINEHFKLTNTDGILKIKSRFLIHDFEVVNLNVVYEDLYKKYQNRYEIPQADLTFIKEEKLFKIKIKLNYLKKNKYKTKDNSAIQYDGVILFKPN